MTLSRRLMGVVGGLGAAATGAAATALTMATRQRRLHRDPYEHEPLGQLSPDRVSTVAADDGVPLYVEEIDPADGGAADITLIGVHGIALSTPSWHFQRRDLAALTLPRVRQVYYDHRGHGQSGPVTHDTATLEQLAHDLHSVIRAVAPDEPIVLMGHSVGGMTIMALAEDDPALFAERVKGVSLIATAAGEIGTRGLPKRVLSKYSPVSWGVGGIGGIAQWQPEVIEFVRAASGQLTKRAVRRLAFGGEPSESVVKFLLDLLDVTPVKELVKFIGSVDSHDRYAVLAGLKHAHVQVIGGDADLILPFSHCERIADELPDAQLVRVTGSGHVPQLEHPEIVNSYLIDLLQLACDTDDRSGGKVGGRVGLRDEALRGLLRRWFP